MVVDTYRLFETGLLSLDLMHLDTNLKSRVPTRANKELRPLLVPESKEGRETRIATKKKKVVPKRRSISAIRDFPPVPKRFNPHLSDERKRAMHTHLTQVSEEYA